MSRHPRVVVIGGGYLGQLIHHLIPSARVLDWRPAAPAGDATRLYGPQYLWRPIPGLKTREFSVVTNVDGHPATDESIAAYKRKVGKEQDASDWRSQFQPVMPGYECELPRDRVEYGMRIENIDLPGHRLAVVNKDRVEYEWLISTIPLPALLDLAGVTRPEFDSRPIYVWTESMQAPLSYMSVNYISDPASNVYRITGRDHRWHYESLIGNGRAKRILPGKIYANSETATVRAGLLMHDVLTVGRFGSWNPEQLAHETYEEVAQWKQIIGI